MNILIETLKGKSKILGAKNRMVYGFRHARNPKISGNLSEENDI